MEKLCECGCGRLAPVAKKTDASRGAVAGCSLRFVRGHSTRPLAVLPRLNRFKVDPATGCWLWKGSRRGLGGYPTLSLNGKDIAVHRLVLEATKGPAPSAKHFACHECDTPPCMNPQHLFWGTNQENSDDMVRKGRSPRMRGSRNGNAVLTEAQARHIKFSDEGGVELALLHDVSKSTISAIRKGRLWAHLQPGPQ